MKKLFDAIESFGDSIEKFLGNDGGPPRKISKYNLPDPIILRRLEYGSWVADYTTYTLWKKQGGGHMLGFMTRFLFFTASVAVFAATPGGIPTAIFGAILVAVIIPSMYNSMIRFLISRKFPQIDVRHFYTNDIRESSDIDTLDQFEKIRGENLKRLQALMDGANSFNRMIKQMEVSIRTLELKGKSSTEEIDSIRTRLYIKKKKLENMINVFGSIIEGETRDVVLDDADYTLMDSAVGSDEQIDSIDRYITDMIESIETDFSNLRNLENLNDEMNQITDK